MARTFDATTEILASTNTNTAPQATGTLAFWFKPAWNAGDGVRHNLFRVFLNTSNVQEFGCVKAADNNLYYGWIDDPTDFDEIVLADTGLFTSGTWGHWAFTWSDSANTMEIFKNASSVATRTSGLVTYAAGTGYTHQIGNGGTANDCRGDMAEYAMWSNILSAADLAALNSGISPLLVSPSTLVLYVPMYGQQSPEANRVSGTFTVTGATAAAHPRVFNAAGAQYGSQEITVAPSTSGNLICWF